jgi:hypothetical protein
MTEEKSKPRNIQEIMPSREEVQRELAKAKSMDDFFGKEGIFARLFAHTIEELLETEMSAHLGYESYEAKGRNSGNNRNGRYSKKLRTSSGETSIRVPRDRNGEFEPAVLLGATGVYRSITAGGSAWARMGFNFILMGTVLWTISLAGDVATASNVSNWLAAPANNKEAMWSAIAALSVSGRGLLALTWIIYWLGLAFQGMAMIQSDVYPRWLGWAALILSVPVTVLGAIQVFIPRSITLTLVFSMLMMLTILWTLITGAWVVRKTW